MALEHCQLLQLPAELLESIFTFLDESNLLSLRLSCTTLERAIFEAFISHYFQRIECFFLDPLRVQRLLRICSTKRLAERIQQIDFTLNVYEGQEEIMGFADNRPTDNHNTLFVPPALPHHFYRVQYHSEQIRYHSSHPSDYRLITTALKHLDARNATLNVDLTTVLSTRWTEISTEASKVIPAISAADYAIHRIRLNYSEESEDLYPDFSPTNISGVLTRVRWFHCLPYIDDGDAGIIKSVDAISRLLPSLKHLESFHFAHPRRILARQSPLTPEFDKLVAAAFSGTLRDFDLSVVRLSSPASLIQLLITHSERMEAVSLNDVTFESNDDRWCEMFEILLRMPKLWLLSLSLLGDANGSWKRYCDPSKPIAERCCEIKCDEQTRDGVVMTLSRLLGRGPP